MQEMLPSELLSGLGQVTPLVAGNFSSPCTWWALCHSAISLSPCLPSGDGRAPPWTSRGGPGRHHGCLSSENALLHPRNITRSLNPMATNKTLNIVIFQDTLKRNRLNRTWRRKCNSTLCSGVRAAGTSVTRSACCDVVHRSMSTQRASASVLWNAFIYISKAPLSSRWPRAFLTVEDPTLLVGSWVLPGGRLCWRRPGAAGSEGDVGPAGHRRPPNLPPRLSRVPGCRVTD